ncbi:type I deoxyribonuclease HsdR [Micromonospora sp. WMMA2032]|uniref:type I restriction endonuclease subunit R n=1 Tax=Micromonospora sp. WMMA2032 TaxID=2039870 RepID=UPI000C05BDCF|nr:HsdR family type I site-specific deoxyribonuclease [Micromonospora sp. WMMA2032]ATO16113.1 type I deoxyribonuclease HsdR [Micromonospora sp. WMMA2032]
MSGFSESSTVQKWLVDRLGGLGWDHVPGKELPRAKTEVLAEEWLIQALETLNREIQGVPERVDEVLPLVRMGVLSAANEGLVAANEQMTTLLRGNRTVKYIGIDEYVPLRLIDFDSPSNNRLVVSDEVTFGPPGKERRFDVVLWVNGIPVVVIETKTPVKSAVSWLNGARDLANVYTVQHPSFFATNVLLAATEGREFHYGAVGQPPEEWLIWGSTADPFDLDGFARVERTVDLLLTPSRVLSVLRDFTLFEQPHGGAKRKLLPRYPQVEGAEEIHSKVVRGRPSGLIEHYQGTGKTLLMAFAALMLINDERVGGPTVLVVLDRLDLIEQVERQFRTAGLPRVSVAETKKDLRRVLREDHRGIVLTTIFRFEREDKSQPASALNDRANIVVLVDEAHRTTEGSLGDDMRAALPNARFFGLTGTPISDKDRNTFKLFGDPEDQGYVMNRYTAERSIFDGASVPIHVETRLVNSHLDKIALDEAFEEMASEEALTDEQREFLAGKAARVKTILMNSERIRAVCTDIVEHFTAKVAPLGMKAQVVAYDRELVVAYETELKRVLANRGLPYDVQVVMSVGTSKDEPTAWTAYDLTREQEAQVKRRFNDENDPLAFVVVTSKLLTGFDAPILFAQYLDKPLRRHTLFQAITRPNRRYTNRKTRQEKRYGLVVDYIGLGQQIAQALKAADPETGGKRKVDVDDLAAEFEARLTAILSPRFDGIDRNDSGFAALQNAMQRLAAADERDAFARVFTGLQTLWEFLYPAPVLAAHKHDYSWLAKVYEAVKPTGVSNDLLWARLGAKTLDLVHGHITDVVVVGTGLEEVVVDPAAIEAMRELAEQGGFNFGGNDRDFAEEPITLAEVLDTIDTRIKRRFEATGAAVYRSLAEKIDQLRAQAIKKAEDSVEYLKKALEVAKLAVQAERLEGEGRLDEAERLLDPNIGALTQIVETYKPEGTPVIVEEVVKAIDSIVKEVRFTGWNETQEGDKIVRKQLRLVLGRYGLPATGPLFDNAYAYVSENY